MIGRRWKGVQAASELQALGLMVTGAPLSTVLGGLAEAGASGDGTRACVILVDQGTGRLRIGGSSGLGDEHAFALDGTAIVFDAGPCGRAAHLGEMVVADGTDARSAEMRLAVRLGGAGCWSAPLPEGEDHHRAGVVLVVGDNQQPTAAERDDARRLAALVAIALGRDRDRGELLHRAGHDRVTGLVNRTVFLDRLSVALARRAPASATPSPSVAVLLVNVDGFHAINDSMGHEVGDRVLMAVADRLRRSVRRGDAVGCLGGDQFVVLSDDVISSEEAMIVAQHLIDIVAKPLVLLGREVFVTARVGVALGNDRTRPERLLQDAAAALALAKGRGFGTCELFTAASSK
jgi:diguanylate cyclase (GGDEF)-like protein